MLHEVNDKQGYFSQIRALLPSHGLFLLVEPRFVLDGEQYDLEVKQAESVGLLPVIQPNI